MVYPDEVRVDMGQIVGRLYKENERIRRERLVPHQNVEYIDNGKCEGFESFGGENCESIDSMTGGDLLPVGPDPLDRVYRALGTILWVFRALAVICSIGCGILIYQVIIGG